jgi:hypothetical protein
MVGAAKRTRDRLESRLANLSEAMDEILSNREANRIFSG